MLESGMSEFAPLQERFRAYPKYRDSCVEWLGKIPAHWEVLSLKRLGIIQAGAGFPDDEQGMVDEDLPFFKVGDLARSKDGKHLDIAPNSISKDTAKRLRAYVFPAGTIVFAKVGAALKLNRRRILTRPACIDNNMMGFITDRCDRDWAFCLLCSLDLGELANPGAVPSVNEGQAREIQAALPPIDEQRAIGSFHDRETAKIDALIEKKERLIELLQEKRTALITQAVTKGLDPTVPMKDSGIEWLGRIPAHWEVKRLKNVARLHTGGTPAGLLDEAFEEAGIPWIKPEQLQGDCGVAAPDRRLSRSAAKSLGKVIAGSSLICGIGTVGKTGYAPFDVCTNQQINAITFSHEVTSRYSQFMVVCLEREFVRRANKVTIAICNKSQMGEVFVCIPQAEEQRSIASFLDLETAKIDALMSRIHEAVIRLKEYRVALVSAAVTGKIDVTRESMLGNSPE
jgi:type I restriction enzyme S subunit